MIKTFESLKKGDALYKFSDSTRMVVIETAIVCYDPRFNRIVTVTKDSMSRLGYVPE